MSLVTNVKLDLVSHKYSISRHSPLKVLALNKSTLLTMAKFTSIAMASCILAGICSSNSDSSAREKKVPNP